MDHYWLSIIPFLVVIPVVLWTKQVIPGLILGLLLGAYFIDPTPLGGLEKSIIYITSGLAKKSNLLTVIFLYLFSGLVEIIKISGGIKGFADILESKINDKKGAMLLTWISIIGTLSAPTFRVVTVTPIMKALLQRLKIPAQELAFVIESTSAPVITLMPIATSFVGYMISLVRVGLKTHGLNQSAYATFIKSIPFNFFSIIMIILGMYYSFFHHQKNNNFSKTNLEKTENEDWHDCHPVVAKDLPSKPLNLLIPLFLLLASTFVITWLSGYKPGRSIIESFLKADVLLAMVVAIFSTIILTIFFFLLQGIKFEKLSSHFIIGGNELMKVILLLAIVWGLAEISQDLGLSKFISKNSGWIPDMLITPALFAIGSSISYFIGSSWGTWGILMPLGISLAYANHLQLPLVIGAVFASGTFGAFASPISGTTITIAKILELPIIKYSKYKLTPALIAAAIAIILYTIVPFIM